MPGSADGQVHKIIRVVATSEHSWEDAARAGVAEATKTIRDLSTAEVVKADLLLGDGAIVRYRVKLEMAFQLDRSRLDPASDQTIHVRRYLVVANQTLPSAGLHELITEKDVTSQAEFHVLVPESYRTTVPIDPMSGVDPYAGTISDHDRLVALDEAEERLEAFRRAFVGLGARLTGEVGVGDPLSAVRRVMDRSDFDEIVVSTLPSGISRWLKLDLPSRLERQYGIPVTHLVQDTADGGHALDLDEQR